MLYLILPLILIIILYFAFSRLTPKNTAVSKLQFHAKKDAITLFGHTISNSLLYTCDTPSDLPFAINMSSAPVFDAIPAQGISYWASYSQLSPIQQGFYIKWLSDGKPEINELGYACLYYYGLEYRALIEKQDLKDVLFEVTDLVTKFNKLSYAYNFILYLALSIQDFSTAEKDALVKFLQENEQKYAQIPAYQTLLQNISPTGQHTVKFSLAQTVNPALYTQLSERKQEILAYYFEKIQEQQTELHAAAKQSYRYDMAMKTVSSKYLTNYFAAYAAIVPSAKVQTMLEQACKELAAMKQEVRKFDASEGPLSEIEKLTYLPAALRDTIPQPNIIDFGDKTINTIESIAKTLGFKPDEKISMQQSSLIVAACEAAGYTIEPNAVLTKKSYRKDTAAIVYKNTFPIKEPSQNCALAALFTDLGLKIALEDSEVLPEELSALNSYIQKEFSLSHAEQYHLQQHQALILHTKKISSTETIKRLIKTSDETARKNIAKFILSLAKADGIIKNDEYKALQKLFQQLGLSEEEFSTNLAELTQNPAEHIIIERESKKDKGAKSAARPDYSEPVALKIDPERLKAIKINTSEIHSVLEEIFAEEQEEDVSAKPAEPKEMIEPENQLQNIITALLEKESWTRDELLKIMQNAGTMLASTIDEINAWSEEEYGDFLIEEENRVYSINEDVAGLIKHKE